MRELLLQYRGPAVEAGAVRFTHLELAAQAAAGLPANVARLLFGDAVNCDAVAVTQPSKGRIVVAFSCTVQNEVSPSHEEQVLEALLGAAHGCN